MKPEEKKLLFEEANHFLTSKGEKLLVAHRRHVVNLIPPLLFCVLFYAVAMTAGAGLLYFSPEYMMESVLIILLSSSLFFFFFAKIIVTWQFHLYIITTKKILEASYVPLSDYYINDILLDQVKCTEVDIHSHGIINEIFDMGDISLTFDRPTNQEKFVMRNIPYVRETASFLTAELLGKRLTTEPENTSIKSRWRKDDKHPEKYIYTEDIFPGRGKR